MKLSRDFIALVLQFARHVERVNKIPLAEALLHFTPLYVAFGLERDFDPVHPIWRAYVAGLRAGRDLVEWTDGFYSERQTAVAPAPACAARLFGCFS